MSPNDVRSQTTFKACHNLRKLVDLNRAQLPKTDIPILSFPDSGMQIGIFFNLTESFLGTGEYRVEKTLCTFNIDDNMC